MMAPGLLSQGGNLPDGLAQDTLVAIHAEGKEHACGIGKMVASSEEVKKAGKGVAVEVVTWIGSVLTLFHTSSLRTRTSARSLWPSPVIRLWGCIAF